MKSLLYKLLTRFHLCATVVFLFATPLFYLLTKHFYAEDMIDIIESVNQGNGIPPLDLERDIMAGVMIQFVLVFIIIFVSVLITVRFVMPRVWLPFDDTLSKTERFNLAQGALPVFRKTDIKEFNRLNESLRQLMQRDKETFRIQKEFTENASHELHTPLAVMCGKLDLLMQEDLNERQMRLVADLYSLTMRMTRFNRNLLLLAKIDNAQYTDMQDVDIHAFLLELLPVYSTLQTGVNVNIDDCRTDIKKLLHANPVLLDCMLKNLIVNALRHSAEGTDVRIVLTDGCMTVVNAADKGPLDASTLFRRFCSGNVQTKGNGLGLAIVKAICDFHSWHIQYSYLDGNHRFVVTFGS